MTTALLQDLIVKSRGLARIVLQLCHEQYRKHPDLRNAVDEVLDLTWEDKEDVLEKT